MPEILITERELEDYLSVPENLKKHFGLEYIARQVRIGELGVVDILAYNKFSKHFVLVELKKGRLDSDAYFQIERYAKGFKQKYARKFQRLLIGESLDSSLNYSVTYFCYDQEVPPEDVEYRLYNIDFNTGISFEFYSKAQGSIAEKFYDLDIIGEEKKEKRAYFDYFSPSNSLKLAIDNTKKVGESI